MRIARLDLGGVAAHVRDDDGRWVPIEDPYVAMSAGRVPADIGDAVDGLLLPPAAPTVIVGIAQNGPGHPAPVQAWLKSPHTLTASGRTVRLRRDAGTTVAEGEIAVVIGRDTSGLTVADAHRFVLGLTAVNDLSSPDRASLDPRNFESKSGDGYTPLGPWIDTSADIDTATLTLTIDGVERARTGSAELPIPIRECLAYVASWTRLGPGDVVMTGAPHSSAPVLPGSVMTVEVDGVRLVTPTV
jgi:2-keto-4-pentenoate hydratase/2-oxohepta-3-ene-1,7-dioic acid hydratase in catechol pathway